MDNIIICCAIWKLHQPASAGYYRGSSGKTVTIFKPFSACQSEPDSAVIQAAERDSL